MIEAMWNVRGLNKLGRLECLKDFIHNYNLDFVGLQETKKANFYASILNHINSNFNSNYLPAVGTACGILVGFRNNTFDVLSWDIKHFSVSAVVKNTSNKMVWKLITVYGSA